jgi:hypothetical protein
MHRLRPDLGDFRGAIFVTSSYTNPENCVAVAAADSVGVKDSKVPHGTVLAFERPQWADFVEFAKTAVV